MSNISAKCQSLYCALLAIAVSACTPKQDPDPAPTPEPDIPIGEIYLQARGDVKTLVNPGQTISIDVQSNAPWDYTVEPCVLVEQSKSEGSLVLALDRLSYTEDVNVTVNVFAKAAPSIFQNVSVKAKCALFLDVEFQSDGRAKDVSHNKIVVSKVDGVSSVVYYNEDAGRNVAKFFSSLGSQSAEGYYKIDYATRKTFMEGLKDGHSMEVQFMLATPNTASGEVKMFSSMDAGGTGFLLTSPDKGGDIAFLPNVSADGNSNWCWAQSGVVPEVGKYYHVVGVWDKAAGKARIYVNGELKNEVSAEGELNLPQSTAARWFCIGGDSCPSAWAENAWNGDVVLARVYDAALRTSDVEELWQKANVSFSAPSLKIDDVLYLPQCVLPEGSDYVVAGDGFEEGDMLRFQSEGYSVDLKTVLEKGRVRVAFPVEMPDGEYKMYAVRGARSTPVGVCRLAFADDASPLSRPAVVAHRGFHKIVQENSVASLIAAQQAGFDAVEIDVWMSTDHKLFVNHDGKVGGKSIQDCDSSQLEGVPTVEEFIEQALKNTATRIIFEVKEHSSAARNSECVSLLVDAVRSGGYAPYAEYICFDLDVCTKLAELTGGAPVGYLSSTADLQGLKDRGVTCADFTYTYWYQKPELIRSAHSLGMKVNIWTVNSGFDLSKSVGLGVDYITTDIPDELDSMLDRLF